MWYAVYTSPIEQPKQNVNPNKLKTLAIMSSFQEIIKDTKE